MPADWALPAVRATCSFSSSLKLWPDATPDTASAARVFPPSMLTVPSVSACPFPRFSSCPVSSLVHPASISRHIMVPMAAVMAVSVRSVSHPCEVSRFMMQFSIWVVIGFINVPLQMCLQSC